MLLSVVPVSVVVLSVVAVISKLDLPAIVTVLRKSSVVIELEISLAENMDTLPGLTSKFCNVGMVERNVVSVSMSVVPVIPASVVVGNVLLVVDSVIGLVTVSSSDSGSGAAVGPSG